MRAAVVGADIARLGAAATRAVAAGWRRDRMLGDIGEALGVDAARFGEPPPARRPALPNNSGWLHSVGASPSSRAIAARLRRRCRFSSGGGSRQRSRVAGCPVEIAPGLPVWVHDDRTTSSTVPLSVRASTANWAACAAASSSAVKRPGRSAIPPRGPKAAAQLAQLLDRLVRVNNGRLERPGIAGQGELHDERRDSSHRVQIGHQRRHVAGPQHEPVDRIRGERYIIGGAAIRIGDTAIAGAQPPQEPVRVKGRNVGAIARRDDHRWLPRGSEQAFKLRPAAVAGTYPPTYITDAAAEIGKTIMAARISGGSGGAFPADRPAFDMRSP